MDGAQQETRYQTLVITKPIATPASTTETSVTLDSDYSKCTGIAVYRVSANNTLMLGITLSGGKVLQEITHPSDWEGDTSVPHHMRYKAVNFKAAGATHKVLIEPTAVLAAAETIHVVFRLQK